MANWINSISKRLDRWLRPQFRVVNRLGCRFLVDNRNWIDRRIILRQRFENEQLAYCQRMVAEKDIRLFFDIGANFGLYSMMLGRMACIEKVYAFEPSLVNFYQLCGNIYVNQLQSKVAPYKKAVSDVSGPAHLRVPIHSTGTARIMEDGLASLSVEYSEEPIDLITIDEQFQIQSQNILIKIDVEGHEMSVVRGMAHLLRANQVLLQIESLSDERTKMLDEIMQSLGYIRVGTMGCDHHYSNFASANAPSCTAK